MENSVYTVERATWAVELALEVLTIVYSSPRKKYAALVKWSEGHGAPTALAGEAAPRRARVGEDGRGSRTPGRRNATRPRVEATKAEVMRQPEAVAGSIPAGYGRSATTRPRPERAGSGRFES